uniref:Inositol polyphosphate multikinase n=1 Tax=Physcomitrium patens TaxID=3218 RepID=A0A7I4EH14_PHYPA
MSLCLYQQCLNPNLLQESASFVMAGMDSAVVGTNGNHLSGSSSSPLPPLVSALTLVIGPLAMLSYCRFIQHHALVSAYNFHCATNGLRHTSFQVFKVADNQVAGHRFEEGRVGSLIDDSGRFYKPLQTGARGDKEVNFFKRFHSDVNVPSSVKSFFPNFFGTIEIDTPNGGGLVRHAVMENLTNGFQHPSVMDVKIGFRTWYLEAGPKYVEKCKLKDQETTSAALGIRVSGMMPTKEKHGKPVGTGVNILRRKLFQRLSFVLLPLILLQRRNMMGHFVKLSMVLPLQNFKSLSPGLRNKKVITSIRRLC